MIDFKRNCKIYIHTISKDIYIGTDQPAIKMATKLYSFFF